MTSKDGLRWCRRLIAPDGEQPRHIPPLIIGASVFFACLFGIYTRPVGFLATIWPANAIMLGILLRMRASASAPGWLAAGVAYLAADLLTGSTLLKALLLNGANLCGVATGYLICSRLSLDMLRLRQPASILYIVFAAAAAAAVAGVVGAIANPILFGGSVASGWTFWFATELANYIAILPVMLAAPAAGRWAAARMQLRSSVSGHAAIPIVAFALSCLVATWVGGPGAIAFPVPALLWCGLAYSVFPTAVLTLLFGCWSLSIVSALYLSSPAGIVDESALVSIRLGASLIALAPIMLASVMESRNDLLARLHDLANHDPLTGADNRHAFREGAQRLFADQAWPVAVLAIDLDHFKIVNDTYGHPVGDEVLVAFAERVRRCLGVSDLLGRVGGEEFAVMVPDCPMPDAAGLAQRLLEAIGGTPIILADKRAITITASIGIAVALDTDAISLDKVLADADAALYRAKAKGRNRADISPGDREASR
ncbi:MAG TPA: diguanylate cyclase [Bordetella sp.]